MLEPRAGDVWHTDDGVDLPLLRVRGYPYLPDPEATSMSNSLVFRFEYRPFPMLFIGDAGGETEDRLLADGVDLRADVLKVGHHGSAYGTTPAFLRAVAPRDAIVSVGRNNLFGHPAPSTIALLKHDDVAVYRTDRDGAVTIESDGRRFLATGNLSPGV